MCLGETEKRIIENKSRKDDQPLFLPYDNCSNDF